jgi:hypothetical protein
VTNPTDHGADRNESATENANAQALRRILDARPVLVDLSPAGEVIPELTEQTLLHAGPPLTGWEEAIGALRGSVLGALVHLKRARDVADAQAMLAGDEVQLLSANDHGAGGTYAGVIARATPVFVVENRTTGGRAFAAINEGRGKALRYGSNDAETLSRLAWLEDEFTAILGAALRLADGVELFEILTHALHMGDDGHSRQKAASALFLNIVSPYVIEAGFSAREAARALRFMATNDIFFLPLTMAAAKSTMASAEGIPGSTVVTCMCANGVRFGIKVSGLGERWFTAPVPGVKGHYFEGYGAEDAGPVIGDSEIAETLGLGAFSMAGAPALAPYMGGTPEEATRLALDMYAITLAEHSRFTIPSLQFRGAPTGIDARRVLQSGITPIFNTGIAHREPGIGQIGAGFANAPMECFEEALRVLGEPRTP